MVVDKVHFQRWVITLRPWRQHHSTLLPWEYRVRDSRQKRHVEEDTSFLHTQVSHREDYLLCSRSMIYNILDGDSLHYRTCRSIFTSARSVLQGGEWYLGICISQLDCDVSFDLVFETDCVDSWNSLYDGRFPVGYMSYRSNIDRSLSEMLVTSVKVG